MQPDNKIMAVSSMIYASSNYSITDILNEIAKCEIVCANCHRRRTIQNTHKCYKHSNQ